MDARKIFSGSVVLLFLSSGMTVVYSQEKPLKNESQTRLLRKDLLQKERKSLDPPKRNIFTPQRLGYKLDGTVEVGTSGRQPGPGDAAYTESPPPETARQVDIRYIGYIGSHRRTVALIIHNGDAVAVEKGEQLSEQVKILDITPQSVEFVGPDSIPNKVFLEGEER